MHYKGTFEINAEKDKVFRFLTDPKRLAECLPDVQKLEVVDQDHFNASIKAGLGFMKATLDFNFTMVEKRSPTFAKLVAKGAGQGSRVDMETIVDLSDGPSGGTVMNWDADVKIGGMLASVGSRLIEGAAQKTTAQLFQSIKKKMEN